MLFRPIQENRFNFLCHKDISCFTECCAQLNLILTPYDIVRMKNRLSLPSDEFLDSYTNIRTDMHERFPIATLRMDHDEKKKCPFVTKEGCTIYEDRPGACRIYPLGRASLKPHPEKDTSEKYFLVNEEHCLGFQEDKEWTLEEWMAHEGVDEYNKMNDKWLEIITCRKSLGPEKDAARKLQMFFMASYNLERFRNFLFNSKFFELFQVEQGLKEKLVSDDVELMKFAFDWLKFSLFGENTLKLKEAETPTPKTAP